MSSRLKAELAATCSNLGRFHRGEYLIEPECIESIKDLIRYLKRDNEAHEIRRFLGESKVVQNDLTHIIKSCTSQTSDLFDVTLRLLINLTTPTMLFYGEEIPAEKIGRNIYLSLIGYSQCYKTAFCDVEFWTKICGKLTDLFEKDWAERSADDGIQIERILMLLRNVLQIPADAESEKRPENDMTVHDKVLWALRHSQILELLLFVSTNKNEDHYYLNLLEIFSLLLREQNPKLLARCDIRRSTEEQNKNSEDLIKVRELEKNNRRKYISMRNFSATFVMKGVKSFSNNDIICHKSLEKVNEMDFNSMSKKQAKVRKNRVPVQSEQTERRSTYSVRSFLKEFCLEFINRSFSQFMNVVKNKLDSGKSLANDQSYYFWALRFFLDFVTASDSNVDLIKDLLSAESFHFVQVSMEHAFEHLTADKKKTLDWVKRIHLILKTYRSLLETLLWMDCSKSPLTRSLSREIKSEIFYVVEYREMTLHVLLLYDPVKFSLSYLKDLIETTHLFIKLLEEYSKQSKLIVQKITKKRSLKKTSKRKERQIQTPEEKWESIKDDVYDILCSESVFPEISPFDATLEIPINDQKGRAMKNIQKLLRERKIKDSIGLLRSARQVWPENDYFGADGMSVEDEVLALQEICVANFEEVERGECEEKLLFTQEEDDVEENEELENQSRTQIVEQDFNIMDYKKRLVNKKVVESCGILLKNYKNNSDHTNHCAIKLLHRIGWECNMPAMLFQASIFWTLLKIMRDNRNYEEINTFAVNLLRKFRKHAIKNPVLFLELLFWKDHHVALEIQHGYEPYEEKPKPGSCSKKKKIKGQQKCDEGEWAGERERTGKILGENNSELSAHKIDQTGTTEGKIKRQTRKRKTKKATKHSHIETLADDGTKSSISNACDNSELGGHEEMIIVNKSRGTPLQSNEDEGKRKSQCQLNIFHVTDEVNESDESEEKLSEDLCRIDEPSEMHEKYKALRNRIIDSSDEENECTRKNQLNEKHPKTSRKSDKNIHSNDWRMCTGRNDKEVKSENTRKANHLGKIDGAEKASEPRSHKSTTRESSDSEIEGRPKLPALSLGESNSSNHASHTSSVASKKRKRGDPTAGARDSSENSGGNSNPKSKRLLFVGSNLDLENSESEDDEAYFAMKSKDAGRRRRRLVVIDSGSDLSQDENS